MFCGKCEKKVDGMHQLFCDPVNRYANPYVCKQCLDEMNTAGISPHKRFRMGVSEFKGFKLDEPKNPDR